MSSCVLSPKGVVLFSRVFPSHNNFVAPQHIFALGFTCLASKINCDDCGFQCSHKQTLHVYLSAPSQEEHLPVDDGFLDLISKSQSRRLDDQRSTFPNSASNTPEDTHHLTHAGEDDLFDTLWRLQGARIDDQRCDMPSPANGLSHSDDQDQERWEEGEAECLSSDELFDMIFECQVCSVCSLLEFFFE